MSSELPADFRISDLTKAERNGAYMVIARYREGAKRALASMHTVRDRAGAKFILPMIAYYEHVIRFCNGMLATLEPKGEAHGEVIKHGFRKKAMLEAREREEKGLQHGTGTEPTGSASPGQGDLLGFGHLETIEIPGPGATGDGQEVPDRGTLDSEAGSRSGSAGQSTGPAA